MYETILSCGLPAALGLIVVGLIVLLLGGETLIRGATALAAAFKIPPVIVGLTIVAWCTSAPEFAVSMNAAFQENADISLGNVLGSNICNICLILGLSAILAPLTVESSMIKREIPLMILLSVLVFLFPFVDRHYEMSLQPHTGGSFAFLYPYTGGLFIGILLFYSAWTVYEVLRNQKNIKLAVEIQENVKQKPGGIGKSIILLAAGIAMLVVGSDAMVAGSVFVAKQLGVSELIIGLTILAVGTSLPELIVSTMAALQGKSELAVGNIVGSSIFNITGVLGPSIALSGLHKGGLLVSPRALFFDIPVMILVSCLCLVICFTGKRVSRSEGVFLLLCYAAYLTALCVIELRQSNFF